MRKSTWIALATALMVCLMGMPAWAADEEMRVPMGEITLQPLTSDAKRASVSFPHSAHFDFNCLECHHTWDKETPIGGCSATGCHDLAEAPKNEQGGPVQDKAVRIRYFKEAFHQSCIGCHKQIEKKNQMIQASRLPGGQKVSPTGPTGCIQCHPKEE